MIGLRISGEADVVLEIRAMSNPRPVMAAAGREAGNRLKKHFLEKERTEPNKLGGKRTHFWRAVSKSVSSPTLSPNGRTVRVDVTHPAYAQKVLGGVIRAKRAKALTIPLTPEAYGRSTAVFEKEMGVKLFVLSWDFGSGALAAMIGNSVKVEYSLRQSVKQDPDPTAMPPQKEFVEGVWARAQSVANRISGKGES